MASPQESDSQHQQQSNGFHHAQEIGLLQRLLDSVVAPSSRRRAYDYASSVASSRPILFSLVASQLLFSFPPILLFVVFTAATTALAVGAAVLFVLFWLAFALLLLLPALIVASSLALLVWAWALCSFFAARWIWSSANAVVASRNPDGHRASTKAAAVN